MRKGRLLARPPLITGESSKQDIGERKSHVQIGDLILLQFESRKV